MTKETETERDRDIKRQRTTKTETDRDIKRQRHKERGDKEMKRNRKKELEQEVKK